MLGSYTMSIDKWLLIFPSNFCFSIHGGYPRRVVVQEDLGMLCSTGSRDGELVTLVVVCSGVLAYVFVPHM